MTIEIHVVYILIWSSIILPFVSSLFPAEAQRVAHQQALNAASATNFAASNNLEAGVNREHSSSISKLAGG